VFNLFTANMSGIYHDVLWYNTIGRFRIAHYNKTEWGKLFKQYPDTPLPHHKLNVIRQED
jgi:hypothetical protein